jgi:hypothetical protein
MKTILSAETNLHIHQDRIDHVISNIPRGTARIQTP